MVEKEYFQDVIEFRALGTEIKIFLVWNDNEQAKQKESIEEEIRNIYIEKEKIFSRFNPGSELSKINSRLGVYQDASEDFLYLAQKSLEYYETSQYYFDPRILEALEDAGYRNDFKKNDFAGHKVKTINESSDENLEKDLMIQGQKVLFRRRMDFSGIAKGYITDLIFTYLIKRGCENFLIDSGGDIRVHGKNEKQEFWQVEIEGIPENKMCLELMNLAVATSGITRRKWENRGKKYHHLINPKNPNDFDFNLKSVTVVASSCAEADVLAKALFLMGREKGLEHSNKEKIRSIFLDYRGDVYLSRNIKSVMKNNAQ